jgi:hypothetical protein
LRIGFEVVAGPASAIRPFFEIAPTATGSPARFGLSYEPKVLMRLMDGMIKRTMEAEVVYLGNVSAALAR